jgi:hypothetical protein
LQSYLFKKGKDFRNNKPLREIADRVKQYKDIFIVKDKPLTLKWVGAAVVATDNKQEQEQQTAQEQKHDDDDDDDNNGDNNSTTESTTTTEEEENKGNTPT